MRLWKFYFAGLIAFVFCSSLLADVVVYRSNFERFKLGGKGGWSKLSSAGKFVISKEGKKYVLRVSARPGEEMVGIYKRIGIKVGEGRLKLSAKVKWISGSGRLFIRVQEKLTPDIREGDIVKLEYRHDANWFWKYCWTKYYNGHQPNPQPIQKPRKFSEASCFGKIEKKEKISDVLVLVQAQCSNDSSAPKFICEIKEIKIEYVAPAKIFAKINQTWIERNLPIKLTIFRNPARDMGRFRVSTEVQSEGKILWSRIVEINDDFNIRTIEIPTEIFNQNQSGGWWVLVNIVSGSGRKIKKIGEWKLIKIGLPKTAKQSTKKNKFLSQRKHKCIHKYLSEYWADDIPSDKQKFLEPPKGLMEISPPILKVNSERFWSENERRYGIKIYPRILSGKFGLYDFPSEDLQEPKESFIFVGERSVRTVGIYAIRNQSAIEVKLINLPDWLKGKTQLRRLLFLPIRSGKNRFTYRAGPFVKSKDKFSLKENQNAYFAVIIEPIEKIPVDDFTLTLRIKTQKVIIKYPIRYKVCKLKLPAPDWYFTLIARPLGNDRFISNMYADMKAMGIDSVVHYNFSPCNLSYKAGKLIVDFNRYEKELRMMKDARLLGDVPFIIDMRFIEAEITRLTNLINQNPKLAKKDINIPRGNPDIEPNYSKLEEEFFSYVLGKIKKRAMENCTFWPKVENIWLLPQDEIEWGRLGQVARFGKLIKQMGFKVAVTSNASRWGWDGPQRLDKVVDMRIYGYIHPDMVENTHRSKDKLGDYGEIGGDYIIGWGYYPAKVGMYLLTKWVYLWPIGGGLNKFYDLNRQPWNCGINIAWPGDKNKILPSIYTFQITQAKIDARLISFLKRLSLQNTAVRNLYNTIINQMPADTFKLARYIESGTLPRRNVYIWREKIVKLIMNLKQH